MAHVARAGRILRAPVLLATGSLVVHEGRYLAGYGDHAHEAEAAQGHAYLSDAVVPTIQVLLVLSVVALVIAFVRAMRGLEPEPRPIAFGPAWLRATLVLQTVYATQELAEGWLSAGHPPGVAGVLGHGGWTAFVIAIAVGAVVALLLRGAVAVVRWAARRHRARPPAADPPLRDAPLPDSPLLTALAPLARGDAGRAPPAFA
jgi:hypothetical protein